MWLLGKWKYFLEGYNGLKKLSHLYIVDLMNTIMPINYYLLEILVYLFNSSHPEEEEDI